MKTTESDMYELMGKLSRLIEEKMGLYFPEERWNNLVDKLDLLAKDFGFTSNLSLYEWMVSTDLREEHIERFASRLTIGETYFYRDKAMLEDLAKLVLPTLIQERRNSSKKLKIWSAGCSSGEEPYSIAMMLTELIPDYSEWNISILATDINQMALSKASSGLYKEWSFRGTPDRIRDTYFSSSESGVFKIDYKLKENIDFQYLNLVSDSFPSLDNNTTAFDFIFCRNVLMYFSPRLGKQTIHKFYKCLLPGAFLAVGGSEGVLIDEPGFLTVNLPQAMLYKKDDSATPNDDTRMLRMKQTSSGKTVRAPESAKSKLNDVFVSVKSTEEKGEATQKMDKERRPLEKVPLRSASGKNEDIIDVHLEKAFDLYGQERFSEALKELEHRSEDTPKEMKALKLLVRLYANLGNYIEAEKACNKALDLDMFDEESYYLQGLLMQEKGEIKAAGKAFFRAIYLNPDFEIAHYAMANLSLHSGNKDKAERYFKNAADLLRKLPPDDLIKGSDGISARKMLKVIDSISNNIMNYEKAI